MMTFLLATRSPVGRRASRLVRLDSLLLVVVFVAYFAVPSPALSSAGALGSSLEADLPGFEAGLNPTGTAYEINPGTDGRLWVSDFNSGQVWAVNPRNGAYAVYAVPGSPSDARQVAGWLWWADGQGDVLGRVSTSDGASTQWAVPGSTGFYGTAVDFKGRLWATGAESPLLYRLDPAAAELCTFTLPDAGASTYIVDDADNFWLGDYANGRLVRLEISTSSLTSWSLPADSSPFGMALDAQGGVWYADGILRTLSRFDPGAERLLSYDLSSDGPPALVALDGDHVWYTMKSTPRVGVLDPRTASGSEATLASQHTTLTPTCTPISPSTPGRVTITAGQLAWTPRTYTRVPGSSGIEAFQLPEGATGWGVMIQRGNLWVVDQGRQMLLRARVSAAPDAVVYLPLCLAP